MSRSSSASWWYDDARGCGCRVQRDDETERPGRECDDWIDVGGSDYHLCGSAYERRWSDGNGDNELHAPFALIGHRCPPCAFRSFGDREGTRIDGEQIERALADDGPAGNVEREETWAPATTTRRLRVRLPPATTSADDVAHERRLSPKCPVRQILSEIRCLAPWVQGGRGLIYCGA